MELISEVSKSNIFSSGIPSLQDASGYIRVDNIIIISISLCYVTVIPAFMSQLVAFEAIKLSTHTSVCAYT